MAPKNAYLEFDAHPAIMMPYMPIDVMAKIYNKPALILARTSSGENGMTAHAASAGMIVSMGAKINKSLFAPVGITISFMIALTASAIGCPHPRNHGIPKKVTLLGPTRICI